MEYTKVYMGLETNKHMFLGESVKGSLEKIKEEDMEITVGKYRITEIKFPFVLVKPPSGIFNINI